MIYIFKTIFKHINTRFFRTNPACTKNSNIFSVAGGGETVAAINKFKKLNSFTFVSTAGGAFLEYLEGKTLPAIKALNQNVWIK